jgi:hypothetical protein
MPLAIREDAANRQSLKLNQAGCLIPESSRALVQLGDCVAGEVAYNLTSGLAEFS